MAFKEVTCFNGGKNSDETDIDCGGEFCKPCNQTQVSTLIIIIKYHNTRFILELLGG